jgi:hypothetical protein
MPAGQAAVEEVAVDDQRRAHPEHAGQLGERGRLVEPVERRPGGGQPRHRGGQRELFGPGHGVTHARQGLGGGEHGRRGVQGNDVISPFPQGPGGQTGAAAKVDGQRDPIQSQLGRRQI